MVKRSFAALVIIAMLCTMAVFPVSAAEDSDYGNLYPADAAQVNSGWGGGSVSFVDDCFDGSGKQTVSFEHTSSLDAYGTVLYKVDFAGSQYAMEKVKNYKHPIEYGKTYNLSWWMKLSDTDKLTALLPTYYYYWENGGYAGENWENVEVKQTTDWQFVSMTFTVNADALNGVSDELKPLEFYFNFFTPNGVNLAEGESFSVAIDDLALREVPAADELVMSYTGMNKVLDGTNCTGVAMTFDGASLEEGTIPQSVKLNGNDFSDYTAKTSVSGNKTTVEFVFDEAVPAGKVTAFVAEGFCDVWGREIMMSVEDGAAAYGNMVPAGATELQAAWINLGAGTTYENVVFDGQEMMSVTANHTASLGTDGVVFGRRDNTGGYSMDCMKNKKMPFEYGKTYKLSTWVKTSSTKLKDLKLWWGLYYNADASGYKADSYPNNLMKLKETTDWQYISMNFTVGVLEGVDSVPDELNIQLLTPSGLALDEGEKFSITFHDFSICQVPDATELLTNFTSMSKITAGGLCTGIALNFDNIYVDGNKLPENVKLNGQEISEYTIEKSTFGNTSTLNIIFDEPIAAADVLAFETTGICDIWGREIVVGMSDAAAIYTNIVPAGATEIQACWPSYGSGNTFETVTFGGEEFSSVTANHTVSLGADATVFARRDNTTGYAMACMQKGEHPFEYGKTYCFSTWVKTSSSKLKDLKFKWTYFYGNSAAVEAYPDSIMVLKETNDWQYIFTTFTIGKLQNIEGAPVELNIELLTPSGLALDEGEKFSITFHEFEICEVPAAGELATGIESAKTLTNADGKAVGMELVFDGLYLDTENTSNFEVTVDGSAVDYEFDIVKDMISGRTILTVNFEAVEVYDSVCVSGLYDIWGRIALDRIEQGYPADIDVNVQYYDGSNWVKLTEMSQIMGMNNCGIKFSAEVKNNTDAPVAMMLYGADYKSDVLEKAAINAGGSTIVDVKAVLSGTMTLDSVEQGETLKFFVWGSNAEPYCEAIEIR